MTLNIFRENKLSFVSNLALWFTFIIEFELSSGKGVLWDKLRQLMEKETGSWVVNMRFLSPPFLIDTCWWNSKRLSRVIRTKKISFIELVNCWIVMFIDSSWSVQSLKKKYQHGRCVDRKSRNTSTRWAGGYYVTAALTRLNEFDDYKTHCYVDRLVLLLTTAKEGLDVISYWWREGYECKGVKRYRFFFSLSLCTGGEMRLLAAFICPHDVMSQTNSRQPPFSPLVSLDFSARLKTCRNCNDWLATIRRKLLRLCCKDISVDDEWTRRRS